VNTLKHCPLVAAITSLFHSSRYVKLICLLLVPSSDLLSQSLNFKNYSVDDVLSSSIIYTAFQDRKGFMWFASDRGVSRYDGYNFINYTTKDGLSDNEVFDFLEDSQGRIWFQTMNGKVSYYWNDRIINSERDTTLTRLDSESHICGMFEDDGGNIWITTNKNGVVNYLKNGAINRFFSDRSLGDIFCVSSLDSARILLITSLGIYSLRFNMGYDKVTEKKQYNFQSAALADPYAKSIKVSGDDVLFKIGYKMYWGNIRYDTFELLGGFSDLGHIYNFAKNDDRVWVCTANGAISYSWQTRKIQQPVLKGSRVSSVFKDREGNYWITTLGDGIFFCTSLAMFSYTEKNGLITDEVTCLAKDNHDKIWLGYGKGVVGYRKKGVVHNIDIVNKSFRDDVIVRKIYSSDNRRWVTTTAGLFLLEDNRIEVAYLPSPQDVIEHPANYLWLGTSHWIYTFNRKKFDLFSEEAETYDVKYGHLKRPGMEGNADRQKKERDRTKAFFLDSRSSVWISTEKNLYRSVNDSLIALDPVLSVIGKTVSDFAELPDQTIIMTTIGNGIFFVKDDTVAYSMGEEHGLSSGICNAIATDDDGIIWVATNEGLNKISGYPDAIKIEYFGIYDGMLSNDISDVLVVNDTVWVATNKGLNFFYKHNLKKTITPPQMYIDRITLHGEPIGLDQKNPVFQYYENDIGIKYTGLSYNNGDDILYRYKLTPESPWRYTKSTSVYLPELSAGDYQFTVASRGRVGTWSKEASVSFLIKKPFWHTYTFIGAAALIFVMIGWAVVAIYLTTQKKNMQWQHRVTISELKTLRAQMNPHFLFNALNAMQGMLLKNNFETAQNYLTRFSKLMRSILDHSDKTTIAIAEELESITNYVEIEQMRANYQFQYTIEISPQIDIQNTEIPAMIVQPFIENAIWHGFSQKNENNRLLIQFTLDDNNAIYIRIKDNGIGRKRAMELSKRTHKSKGIQLVRERIDILNFENKKPIELHIEDLENGQSNDPGTIVTIKIPSL
jgi:ligand-binding sensor domain-containing protein/two-component sensor histidine kinase